MSRREYISTHTPLAGRDVTVFPQSHWHNQFLLTRPSRDVTNALQQVMVDLQFLLTRPSRDVTGRSRTGIIKLPFLLTRPSRDVTKCSGKWVHQKQISTHTPLAGRDILAGVMVYQVSDFYSHAPRGT